MVSHKKKRSQPTVIRGRHVKFSTPRKRVVRKRLDFEDERFYLPQLSPQERNLEILSTVLAAVLALVTIVIAFCLVVLLINLVPHRGRRQ